MKNNVCVRAAVLFLAVLFPVSVTAAVKFDLGLKAGVSIARIREAYDEPSYGVEYSDRLTRPVFGAFVAINLAEWFAIQPEIYLLTQGGKWPDPVIMAPERLLLRYIHIPILAVFHPPYQKGKFIPFVLAGPSFDIFLSVRDWYYHFELDEWILFPLPVSYKSTVGGFVLGAGIVQKLNHFMLILDIRSNIGMSHIGINAPHEWGRTRALMVMLGVGF